jgi:hypothetical protein
MGDAVMFFALTCWLRERGGVVMPCAMARLEQKGNALGGAQLFYFEVLRAKD